MLTNAPERRNRRTVTEVVGYAVPAAGFDFDGKRAYDVYKHYVRGERTTLAQPSYGMDTAVEQPADY